ncbi:CaiB/BaiF CoA transferase family protein [Pararhodobacter aggregans]|uniref:CoA transferase n=1 Tax=Pararhodobacter aggregans TaxID=404875 RepID=A0A2T7UM28_9RHOB|nr:CoA transferase [Pararhodobacter aggregans]PTW99989.1 crotonobetainyl-CoA:carnitine CoA-transferase CaiB-like acyl-CoA transferase [Pararhodobacter aggregans]PVE45745.1 CoA transferase [Pararhodobacter aggregans]
MNTGPLYGVTIIDVGQIYNGPYCTFLLAMAGARVIKIEPPRGDPLRRRTVVGGAALPFAMLNSNKDMVSLNLKTEQGRDLFRAMVKRADAVVENYAPGTMDKLGVGYEDLKAIKPDIVYAAGSGYGRSGPKAKYPAMDLTVQAMTGVMSTTGFPDRPPVKAGPAIADFFGGVHLYAGLVTALYDRAVTGRGRLVEVAMMEALYPSLSSSLGLYYGSHGDIPPRTGNRHAGLAEAPYNVYPTSDGHIAIICVSDQHWIQLTEAMQRPDLAEDPALATLKQRVERMDDVDALVADFTRQHAKQPLFDLLSEHRVPCAPVRTLDEVINDDHLHARGALEWIDHPMYGRVALPRSALRFHGQDTVDLRPSGELGRDNAAVFQEWLGLSPEAYARMRDEGVI